MMRFIHKIASFIGIAATVATSRPSATAPPTFDLPQFPMRMRKRGQGKSRNLKHAIRRKQIAKASRRRNRIAA